MIGINFGNCSKKLLVLILSFLFLVFQYSLVSATEHISLEKNIDTFVPENKQKEDDGNESQLEESFLPICSNLINKDIKASCISSYLKKFSNYEFELNHRENVLHWQHLSTIIILFVVLILVSMGLYFAWVQFHAESSEPKKMASEVSISVDGLKISSPVLGIIILALSLGFFYLYLIYVYPIKLIG